MNKIKPWFLAFRLRTLPLSVSGIIIGSCFAHYNGVFDVTICVLAILTTISLQVLSNLSNDYGDGVKGTDDENRVGPERAIQSGIITPDEMIEGIKFNILVVIILSVMLIYISFGHKHFLYALLFFFLSGASIYAAMNYTIGSSAYGYRALGDVFVFVFFGLLSVVGSYFLYSKQLDHHVVLPAISIGLLCVGVLNLNNMRDIETDVLSEKITLAVKLGKDKAKVYHVFLVATAMLIAVIFSILYFSSFYNFLYVIAFIPLAIHLKKIIKAEQPIDFDPQLKVLALTTFLFSILLGVGYIL
ncbi:1,4-dihydroxy-2-naphthoate octaprenyltransferase [Ichthyenterobacterium magnum]|uniref:1,4-dihydroxy-2-naphthoate octaprenyltransferase n=1 Tax=Ichthyenterobacterium magnum TaxID=1230530 RepID=A0A420DLV3_9FLAO|nr:1,4-dihydroxy-2-naphthoate octaprenyltransferase [Ichthyenterobacterium magnum]RKE95178.1 1,4-dihydroxy-2-naphthoate prenyltransferase [Ichthyenterobacterium magnum]